MSIGFVLSGGGALGDFEVGALQFLIDQKQIQPDIICGTSAGAAISVGVASGMGLEKLEAFYVETWTTDKAIYEPQEWLLDLTPELQKLITFGAMGELSALRNLIAFSWREIFSGGLLTLDKAFQAFQRQSVYIQSVVCQKYREIFDFQKAFNSPTALRLAAINVDKGNLVYFVKGSCDPANPDQLWCGSPDDLSDALFASGSFPGFLVPFRINTQPYVDGSLRETVPLNAAIDGGADTIFVILSFPRGGKSWPIIETQDMVDQDDSNILQALSRSVNIILDEVISGDLVTPYGWNGKLTIIDPLEAEHAFMEFDPGLIKINLDYGYMRAFDVVQGPLLSPDDCMQCAQLTQEIIKSRIAISNMEKQFIDEWYATKYSTYHFSHRSPDPLWLFHQIDTSKYIDAIRQAKVDLKQRILERKALVDSLGVKSMPDPCEYMYQQWERHRWELMKPTYSSRDLYPLIPTPWVRIDLGNKVLGDLQTASPCGKVVPAANPP